MNLYVVVPHLFPSAYLATTVLLGP